MGGSNRSSNLNVHFLILDGYTKSKKKIYSTSRLGFGENYSARGILLSDSFFSFFFETLLARFSAFP